MLKEQVQAYLISFPHKSLWRIIGLAIFTFTCSSCISGENRKPIQVVCDSIIAQSEISNNVRLFDTISFQDNVTLNILLKQDTPLTYNTYQWNIVDQTTLQIKEQNLKYPFVCDCELKVIDESPDGNWQIVDAQGVDENNERYHQRWLISQNHQYEIGSNSQNWIWSTDGSYFSYMIPGHSYSGSLSLLNLETLDFVWISYEDIEEFGDIPDGFLKPVAFNYNITFSPVDNTYWYRAWFPEDQNRINIYDPINHKGRVEHIKSIRSAIWNQAHNQLMFVKSDREYITITSEDESISAKIPYELYLEIDGFGLESELTHTNFQVSPDGDFVVFPQKTQMYALGCKNEP